MNDETSIFNEINLYRKQQGLPRLKIDSLLSREARNHSREMAENIIPFSHDKFSERKSRVLEKFSGSYAIAENVVLTERGLKYVVPLWLHSSGHRKNIEGSYNLTGVGVARNHNGRIYVTQLFLQTE